ncbi:potassium channel family protein [Jongsikchunia kroppenstedtii]|uniref:potassium channel family protein n=1 Tax=Jongsikchunia kroppenstedtii TaxID=1121721 RepID=UPI00037B0532|nr:potassium channel family protein [Jongsikchunia kroppenstedtii]
MARRRWRDGITSEPAYALVGTLRIPGTAISPGRAVLRRVLLALGILFAAMLIVYADRSGYRDVQDNDLSFLDAAYYTTVSLSTTGYGDVTPFTPEARLINVLLITPLRVLFLITLVGTTLEVLTERSRQAAKIRRWRSQVHDHTIIIGYGTKGKTAVDAMLGDGAKPTSIVVVDPNQTELDAAERDGLVTVRGDGTKSDVLRLAGVEQAASIVIAPNRDDTTVLATLTARELAPKAKIVVAVREAENTHLMRQSGADSVVVSAETAGRLLGLATSTPSVVEVIEDLLSPEDGLGIGERDAEPTEYGGSPRHTGDMVLAVVRGGSVHRVHDVDSIEEGDRLLYVRRGGM